MSLRILHLASVNYVLQRDTASLHPDPLALINLGDLNHLSEENAISFLEDVLVEFRKFNPVDNIAIRTSVSTTEYERRRPFKLHLELADFKQNAHHAFEASKIFAQRNPKMKVNEAWLIFGMSIKELFSGNVNSDVYWPDRVIMEVTTGPLQPLANGEITRPENWILEKDTGRMSFNPGSNSPVLGRFLGKELGLKKIRDLMTFASNMPCTLEFIYGYIKKVQDFRSLIIDVRVLPNVEWDFCGTRSVWKVLSSTHFLEMLGSIAFVAAMNDHLIEKREELSLVIGPKGSLIASHSRNVNLRSLFGIEVFSSNYKTFDIHPLLQ